MTRRIPPVRRLLMDAKALIQRPKNWTQRAYSRDAKGKQVGILSSEACRFCAEGTLLRVYDETEVYQSVNRLLRELIAPRGLVSFNDAPGTTHRDIMRLFNKAIRAAKEQGI